MQRFKSRQDDDRPVCVTSRRQALATLDNMMRECGGQTKRFSVRLTAAREKDPVRFFREIVITLLSRKAIDFSDRAGVGKRRTAAVCKGGAR